MRLRGRPDRGLRGLSQVALPVLEGALERSVALAAAMDARGYGRTADVPARVRRTTTVLTLGGLLGVCAGTYGLLTAAGGTYGLPVLVAGALAALAGLRLGGRRSPRTRYRPDRWTPRACLVAGSGVAVAALMTLMRLRGPAGPASRRDPPDRARAPPLARRGRTPRPAARAPPRSAPEGAVVVIRFENVSVTYDGCSEATVQGVDFTVPEGELVLLAGPSGVGKSTLLGTVGGLVPHFTGGTLRGRVTVATATPVPTSRVNSPTWWGRWARTRCRTSSRTPSRRNSPTAWSPWVCPRR